MLGHTMGNNVLRQNPSLLMNFRHSSTTTYYHDTKH